MSSQGPWPRGLTEDVATGGSELSDLLTVGRVAMVSGKQEKPEAERMLPVPEPTTMLLFGAGLIGLAGLARKQYKTS